MDAIEFHLANLYAMKATKLVSRLGLSKAAYGRLFDLLRTLYMLGIKL